MTTTIPDYPLLISGEKVSTGQLLPVQDKFTGELYAHVHQASKEDVSRAIQEAKRAQATVPFGIPQRYEVLMKAAQIMRSRAEELADIMVAEAGKIKREALFEVYWSADIFTESAEESRRLHGETFSLPVPGLDQKTCYTLRQPVGVVGAITPFNFPLNLVAHKVAPALAGGNAVVLKPAEKTPVIAYKLCEILLEAGLPAGYLQYLGGEGATVGEWMIADPGIDYYSFTGSVKVGKRIKEATGLRRVSLELGSNSATIVHSDADPAAAAAACSQGAFSNAGQVCISVQRIYVHETIYDRFLAELISQAELLKVGDPRQEDTGIGPMIAEKEAIRVQEWIEEAVQGGAVAHTGNKREGAHVWPTVLSNVSPEMKVVNSEVFGPVVSVTPYSTLDEAIDHVNRSDYGLQAGILTNDLQAAMQASRRIRTGGVIVGGTSAFRIGCMPYGGVKNSGIGREGPRYAIEEMTDLKTVVLL
ncbi:aldehyde dehydrogenase family protein [Paenibacillus nasutitermitis]|uniref:Aldehyde dehydrogenase n=1 Tax=Paenibacillus nasutitermitis TaxID=1652958 RepID=A0A916Z5U1_9BACL|nr:aldehyde dehydrogenase family protein [Paenibacillus nasutitermitis]GGD77850.1 aldehyde dehydrogenase [Paenibacillus nasutitermitis]